LGYIAPMPGNMTKAQALEWLTKYGAAARGYPQEPAAAYMGLGVKRFRDDVAAGRLPQPQKHGKRLIWNKIALDRYMNEADGGVGAQDHDPIMASIHAAQSSPLRAGDQS
jgi:hypothetical protein